MSEDKDSISQLPPDSASAALRAAFLELSNSTWDLEKEIKASSSELFDSADDTTPSTAINSVPDKNEADRQNESILEDIIAEKKEKNRKNKKKPLRAKKSPELKSSENNSDKTTEGETDTKIEENQNSYAKPADENESIITPPAQEDSPEENSAGDFISQEENQNYPQDFETEKNQSEETENLNGEKILEKSAESLKDEAKKEGKKNSKVLFNFFANTSKKIKGAISSAEKNREAKKLLKDSQKQAESNQEKEETESSAETEIANEAVQASFEETGNSSYSEIQNEKTDYTEESSLETTETSDESISEESAEAETDAEKPEAEKTETVIAQDENPSVSQVTEKEKNAPNYWQRMFAKEDKSSVTVTKHWKTIMKRELRSYFTSPIAYIVAALFLSFSGFLFFSTFFLADRAELRDFFMSLPMLFSFFIPALTMRLFSEEKKSSSLETLMTLPVTTVDVVLGKYFAALISSLFMLLPTLSYVIACNIFGQPDAGPIWGGYIGAVFLAASFTAIGLFSSSTTKNQILAFFVALAICIFLTFVNSFTVLLPPFLSNLFTFISASSHFDSVARGILDTRDLIYFISVTVFFVVLTIRSLNKSRKD